MDNTLHGLSSHLHLSVDSSPIVLCFYFGFGLSNLKNGATNDIGDDKNRGITVWLMAMIKKKKSFWCENKDVDNANDENGNHGGEHQHNNDIYKQWEKEVQMMK